MMVEPYGALPPVPPADWVWLEKGVAVSPRIARLVRTVQHVAWGLEAGQVLLALWPPLGTRLGGRLLAPDEMPCFVYEGADAYREVRGFLENVRSMPPPYVLMPLRTGSETHVRLAACDGHHTVIAETLPRSEAARP